MKKNISIVTILFFILCLVFYFNNIQNGNNISTLPTESLSIEDGALPIEWHTSRLENIPTFNALEYDWTENFVGLDLIGYDLSHLNLKDYGDSLMYASFNTNTIWPEKLPDNFNPDKILELGKNPGLNVRQLHKQGITGKGIGIAIIDGAILTEHEEYKDSLKHYEIIHDPYEFADYHGVAVASIATGKTVGVAPDADLYYFAAITGEEIDGKFERNDTWFAQGIRRVIELNTILPPDRKIRVISISNGISQDDVKIAKAIKEAQEEGIFVVTNPYFMLETLGYYFDGLDRKPLKDPDDPNSYEPGLRWADEYYKNEYLRNREKYSGKDVNQMLLTPMDSKSVASPVGIDDYDFYRGGGPSWSIPYIAGIYALACQVKPEITPEEFWTIALNTGDTIEITHNSYNLSLGKIVNPNRLIDTLSSHDK